MFATKREGVLVVGSAMVNTGIYAPMVGFAAGVVGSVVGVLIYGKGMMGDQELLSGVVASVPFNSGR